VSLKSPESVLRVVLSQNTAVSSLVGTQIYPVIAPSEATYPFVIWRRIQVQRQHHLAGPMGSPRVTVEYAIYGATYDQARNVSDAMRRVLDGYRGVVDNTVVQHASVENETDDFVSLTGAELPPSYQITMTVDTWWIES
jgi:hypothetical protein